MPEVTRRKHAWPVHGGVESRGFAFAKAQLTGLCLVPQLRTLRIREIQNRCQPLVDQKEDRYLQHNEAQQKVLDCPALRHFELLKIKHLHTG